MMHICINIKINKYLIIEINTLILPKLDENALLLKQFTFIILNRYLEIKKYYFLLKYGF